MITLPTALESIRVSLMYKPLEIHDIYLGSQTSEDSNTLHYANYYKTVSFFTFLSEEAQDYTGIFIKRNSLQKSSQGEIEGLSYIVDNVNRGVSSYASANNFRNKRIVTRLVFRDQLGSPNNAKVIFDGLIQGIAFTQKSKTRSVTLSAAPKIGSLNFETGWPYEIPCNAKFGDEYCKVEKNSADNKVTGTATGGTTSTVIDTTNLTQIDNYWNHGQIEFTSGANVGVKRKIIDSIQSSKTLILDYNLSNAVSVGDTFEVYRGCDKTLSICGSIYNNQENYHGFHTIPLDKTTK